MIALVCVFFFKQKTAYEMRISDWSSDVCSSDLFDQAEQGAHMLSKQARHPAHRLTPAHADDVRRLEQHDVRRIFGQASREAEHQLTPTPCQRPKRGGAVEPADRIAHHVEQDRKSTRLNSSH